jgi:hypothetical protein
VAPAWCGPAIAAALVPLHNSIDLLHLGIMRASNKAIMSLDDPISQLPGVVVAGFPVSQRELRELSNAACIAIIGAYRIPNVHGTLHQRRQAIANYLGLIRY